jgi:hypothetical protein
MPGYSTSAPLGSCPITCTAVPNVLFLPLVLATSGSITGYFESRDYLTGVVQVHCRDCGFSKSYKNNKPKWEDEFSRLIDSEKCTPEETLLITDDFGGKNDFLRYPESYYELDKDKIKDFIRKVYNDWLEFISWMLLSVFLSLLIWLLNIICLLFNNICSNF